MDSHLVIFDARNIDLPRKVRYHKRKAKRTESFPYQYREGRTYADFKNYIECNPDVGVVEMDTVKGCKEKRKCLLTMIFTKYDFMLLFLLDTASQICVQEVFDLLLNALGLNIFRRLFPVILTNNGSEFKSPDAIEKSKCGSLCTRVFTVTVWLHGRSRTLRRITNSFDMYCQRDIHLRILCNLMPYYLQTILTALRVTA